MEVDSGIVAAFINAAVNDHPEADRLLDANPNLRQATWMGDEPLLHFLVIENYPQAVEFCLKHGFDPNQVDAQSEDSALIYASLLNYTEVAEVLLAGGADPNAKSSITRTRCIVVSATATPDWWTC